MNVPLTHGKPLLPVEILLYMAPFSALDMMPIQPTEVAACVNALPDILTFTFPEATES